MLPIGHLEEPAFWQRHNWWQQQNQANNIKDCPSICICSFMFQAPKLFPWTLVVLLSLLLLLTVEVVSTLHVIDTQTNQHIHPANPQVVPNNNIQDEKQLQQQQHQPTDRVTPNGEEHQPHLSVQDGETTSVSSSDTDPVTADDIRRDDDGNGIAVVEPLLVVDGDDGTTETMDDKNEPLEHKDDDADVNSHVDADADESCQDTCVEPTTTTPTAGSIPPIPTHKEVGLTRYIMVITVVALSFYNIHLYLSQ